MMNRLLNKKFIQIGNSTKMINVKLKELRETSFTVIKKPDRNSISVNHRLTLFNHIKKL